MVNILEIQESNARFAHEIHKGLVCVFAGATSGIGLATLQKLTTLLQSSTFYVLGRPEKHFSLLDNIRTIASSNKIIFIEMQFSLISSIDEACAQITSAEQKVDYLCMSPGGMPFQGAVCTCLRPLYSLIQNTNILHRHKRRTRNLLHALILFPSSTRLQTPSTHQPCITPSRSIHSKRHQGKKNQRN